MILTLRRQALEAGSRGSQKRADEAQLTEPRDTPRGSATQTSPQPPWAAEDVGGFWPPRVMALIGYARVSPLARSEGRVGGHHPGAHHGCAQPPRPGGVLPRYGGRKSASAAQPSGEC